MAKAVIIVIKPEDKTYLDSMNEHPRETYGDQVSKLIKCWKNSLEMKAIDKPQVDKEFVTPDPDSPTGIKEPIPSANTG